MTDLPRMGSLPSGPRRLTSARADAIRASTDREGMVDLLAYARSYYGAAGGAVIGGAATVALALLGRPRAAAGAVAFAAFSALGTIETRRRARRWETALTARIAWLDAESSAGA